MPYKEGVITTIGLNSLDKERLQDIKNRVEKRAEREFSWGEFLLGIFTGLITYDLVKDFVEKGPRKLKRETRN